jgi:alpha-mannosidase
MPVPLHGPCLHRYEIPYGVVTRQPYTPSFRWAGANGDWPAINWAGVEQADMSVALFDQGTPSYRIENAGDTETILLSLLRSPCIPTYLHEPMFYTMTDYDGMRDEGDHDFAFAISAYPQPFAESSVVLDANAYNAGLLVAPGYARLPALPALDSGVARISAVKWAEADDGLVLRLVEFRGQGGDAVLKLPFPVKSVEKVNLLERHGEPVPLLDQSARITLRPWEITTIKLVL